MKTFAALLAFLPLAASAGEAPIRAVTIYEDRALVTRAMPAALPAGRSTLRFEGLPPGLDERTLRAGIEGAQARVVGLGSAVARTLVPADDRVRDLEARIEALGDGISAKSEALAALDVERRYLESYRAFAKAACSEATTAAAPPTGDWERTLAFLRERAEAADAGALALERERQELGDQRSLLQQEIRQRSAPGERLTRSAEVAVEADQAGNAVVTLSYQVAGASWSPLYDARFDPATAAIDFRYFGAVRQQTGEDWTDIRVTLSTARPSVGAERPKLAALQLTGRKREPVKEHFLVDRMAPAAGLPAPAAPQADAAAEDPLSVARDRGPSVTFEIVNPATIPADGRPARVAIAAAELKPELAFEAVPKLRPYAFLKATQPNPMGIPLLAGPVQVSRASGYVGTTDLKFTAPGELLSLSLGVDEAVKVHRRVVRETEEEGKGLANRRVLTRIYDIEAANYTGAAQRIRVLDQLPVSRLEAVEVRLAPSTTPPDTRDADGLLAWVLPLAPGEKRTIHLEFTVTMPQNYRLP